MDVRRMSEVTLQEVKDWCHRYPTSDKYNGCSGCLFFDTVCGEHVPEHWELGEDENGQAAAKAEPARPRICDLLGVDVNEEFSFSSETRQYKRAKVNERGRLVAWDDSGDCWNCVGNHGVCWLINHPDALRKQSKAKLTADEIAICKVLGAKWVSMDDEDEGVQLWASRPIQGEDERFENDADYIAGTVNGLFPSVHPGNCIEVPE